MTTGVLLEALFEAEGACTFSAGRRFPRKPYVKVVCTRLETDKSL